MASQGGSRRHPGFSKFKEIFLADDTKQRIYVDKDNGTFMTQYGADRFEGKDLNTIEIDVRKAAEKAMATTFEPVITLDLEDFGFRNEAFGFNYTRKFRGGKPEGPYIWREWLSNMGDEYEDVGYPGQLHRVHLDTDDIVIPYTKEKWLALKYIQDELKKIKPRIREILRADTEGVLAKIIAGSDKLITFTGVTAQEEKKQ